MTALTAARATSTTAARATPQRAVQKQFPPSTCCVCCTAAPCPQEGATTPPYLMITSEAVGSWLKSAWIRAAALRKCRSRGPGVGGRLAAEQREGGVRSLRWGELGRKRLGISPPSPWVRQNRLHNSLSLSMIPTGSGWFVLSHAQPKPGVPLPRVHGAEGPQGRPEVGFPTVSGLPLSLEGFL